MKLRYLTPLVLGLTFMTTLPAAAQSISGLAGASSSTPLISAQVTPAGPVHVDLTEWSITPVTTVIPAGLVTFEVTTPPTAAKTHELQVIKSDLPIDALPINLEGDVDETQVGERIGLIEQVRPGDVDSATFTLAPGRYVLLCNLAEHYIQGMVTEIQVQ
jgi:uncharacterized cupredoxin-like copper-binding protein